MGFCAYGMSLASPCSVRVHAPLGLKLKANLTLTVTVTGGSSERITWGGGEAVMLAFRYTHPRTGTDLEIR
jgi:hypothetical protein